MSSRSLRAAVVVVASVGLMATSVTAASAASLSGTKNCGSQNPFVKSRTTQTTTDTPPGGPASTFPGSATYVVHYVSSPSNIHGGNWSVVTPAGLIDASNTGAGCQPL